MTVYLKSERTSKWDSETEWHLHLVEVTAVAWEARSKDAVKLERKLTKWVVLKSDHPKKMQALETP